MGQKKFLGWKFFRLPMLCILNIGTVPMLCILYVGTVPTFRHSHFLKQNIWIWNFLEPKFYDFFFEFGKLFFLFFWNKNRLHRQILDVFDHTKITIRLCKKNFWMYDHNIFSYYTMLVCAPMKFLANSCNFVTCTCAYSISLQTSSHPSRDVKRRTDE